MTSSPGFHLPLIYSEHKPLEGLWYDYKHSVTASLLDPNVEPIAMLGRPISQGIARGSWAPNTADTQTWQHTDNSSSVRAHRHAAGSPDAIWSVEADGWTYVSSVSVSVDVNVPAQALPLE